MSRRNRTKVATSSPNELYPADPEWLAVSNTVSPVEAILLSLDINPIVLAALLGQAQAEAVDSWDVASVLTQPPEVTLSFGPQEVEYERRQGLLDQAIRSGSLSTRRTDGGVLIEKKDLLPWLRERQWVLPKWLEVMVAQGGNVPAPPEPTPHRESGRRPLQHTVAPPSDPNRGLRLPEVIELTGLGRSTIYASIAGGSFPKQRKQGKVSIWKYRDIVEWLDRTRT